MEIPYSVRRTDLKSKAISNFAAFHSVALDVSPEFTIMQDGNIVAIVQDDVASRLGTKTAMGVV